MLDFLLDADETVLDFVRSSKESLAHAMRAAGLAYDENMFDIYKRINDGVWREYEEGKLSKPALMHARFSRFFGELGVSADPDEVNALYFDKLCGTGYLLDGAGDFLRDLKERGRVFVITNGTPAAQYGRLVSLGLDGFFDGVYVSDEIGYKKPDPRFFEYLLCKEKLLRENCLVIGDSLTSDIAGANAAGIRCVWYAPSGRMPEKAKPDYIARSYREILQIIDAINGSV